MKKYIYYIISLFLLQVAFAACTDTEIYDSSNDGNGSNIKIVLNVPVDNGRTRGLIYGEDEDPIDGESKINDIYVLAFNKQNSQYLGKFQASLSANNTLIANINVDEMGLDAMTVVVLANLNSLENGNELVGKIDKLTKGTAKDIVLNSLKYDFTKAWTLKECPLPMWGETDITPVKEQTVSRSVNLYRAVSKINVIFNEGKPQTTTDGTEVFKLNSVRVYYARTSGLAGSLYAPETNQEGGSDLITKPSIPENVEYFSRYKDNDGGTPNNLLFESGKDGGVYAIENQIYVPESDQTNTKEPMCLVIGGYYMGSDQETYYRVDFKEGNKGTKYYDAIRNHIYNFNINTVTRPGTDEPDPALDHVVVGMDVTIKDWTTEYMQGIGGQYTLKTSTGGFVLAATNTSANKLTVETTHNEGWTFKKESGEWFDITKSTDGLIITPKAENKGGQRYGSFVITSGNLNKVITVRQQGKGTANCYVVSDAKDGNGNYQHILHDLIVTVKGNGEEGMIADGHAFEDQSPYLNPDDVKVIWETADGLINIRKQDDGKAIINESGIIQYSVDLTKQNTHIKASDKNQLGGNALIGAFKNGEIIWTWHIWVCPDFDSGNNPDGEITTAELIAHTQTWATNGTADGYDFLDRYLGALSNKPGLASLGLLYQWGRKDPFIGAASISESQKNNRMETFNLDGYDWKNSEGNLSIGEAIKKPTTLIKGTITGVDYSFLWGTDKGFSDVRDAGNKTIYDPCPIGYRVPPVSAIVFKNGSTTSEKTNYKYNNAYWPNTSSYISPEDAGSYGFWINYINSTKQPSLNNYKWGTSNPTSIQNATWLPLAGVYDGNVNEFALVDGNNSLTVNSIIWTNSSVTVSNQTRPGALFLHGTEPKNSGNGRHLHRLIENSNELYAKKTHAGSVRCIRDTKSSIQNAIQVPSTIRLGYSEGSTISDYLTSITESWEVSDPGAMWFVMTPDQGGTGSRQVITFKATATNPSSTERTAILKIKFSDNTERTITVIQEGKPRPISIDSNSLTFAGYISGWFGSTSAPSSQTINISGDENWEATVTSGTSWLSISNGGYGSSNKASGTSSQNLKVISQENSGRNASTRYGTITLKGKTSGTTFTINVTQGTYKE